MLTLNMCSCAFTSRATAGGYCELRLDIMLDLRAVSDTQASMRKMYLCHPCASEEEHNQQHKRETPWMYRMCSGRQCSDHNTSWRQGLMRPSSIYHSQSDWHSYNCLHSGLRVNKNGIDVKKWGSWLKADIYALLLRQLSLLLLLVIFQAGGPGEVISRRPRSETARMFFSPSTQCNPLPSEYILMINYLMTMGSYGLCYR
jgi:hypothetical protein